MQRLSLALAVSAVIAAAWHAPGQYVAIGLGITAIGTGWVGYTRRTAPGLARLAAAGAITLGAIAVLLGVLRVVLALAAIAHIDRMVA